MRKHTTQKSPTLLQRKKHLKRATPDTTIFLIAEELDGSHYSNGNGNQLRKSKFIVVKKNVLIVWTMEGKALPFDGLEKWLKTIHMGTWCYLTYGGQQSPTFGGMKYAYIEFLTLFTFKEFLNTRALNWFPWGYAQAFRDA